MGIRISVRLRSSLILWYPNTSHSGALFSLPNGGPGGAIWMYLIAAFFYYLVTLSMAEMASMLVFLKASSFGCYLTLP
jgi:amino acid permease